MSLHNMVSSMLNIQSINLSLFITIHLIVSLISCAPQDQEPAAATAVTTKASIIPGYTQLKSDELHYLQNKGFGATRKTFRPTVAYEDVDDDVDDEYDNNDSAPESSQSESAYSLPNYPVSAAPKYYTPNPAPNGFRKVQQSTKLRPNNKLEEDEEEKEEPDRLTLLLPQSKFQCHQKKTGYYADEDLGCEVFHYCHENAKHSWICPEGFTFHQIQLICMPPGGDNICEKSSDYHFVNDYLYKPVNLQEYQQKPNVSLRYSDRYFPDSYKPRYDDDDDVRGPTHHQHSIRVTNAPARHQHQHHQQIAAGAAVVPAAVQSTTFRPQSSLGQVFRSPEEINISLQQRRPQFNPNKYYDEYQK